MSIKTAIILNGGKRMSEVDPKTPLPLIEINSKCFLQRQIDILIKAGIENIIISTCYLPDNFDEFVQAKNYKDVNIYTIKDRSPLGSGGAVKNILLNSFLDSALVLNGNTFIDFDIIGFLRFHEENTFTNNMVLTKEGSNYSKKSFKVKDSSVKEIISLDSKSDSDYISAGVYILDLEIFNITHLQSFSLEEDILQSIVNVDLGAYISEKRVYKIDSSATFESTQTSIDT